MMKEDGNREIALLLDWENIRFGLQQQNLAPNISAIMEEAQALGRVVVARAYADFQNHIMFNDPRRLYAAGIEPVYVPGRVYQNDQDGIVSSVRKNSVDVKLTADCVEFCYRYPNIDAYMLVSGDGDFIHLVKTLRPYGKFVAIVALSWTASPRLTESADWVKFYDLDVEPSVQRNMTASLPDSRDTTDEPISDELREVYESIKDITNDRKGPIVLAALKPLLTHRIRDFDETRFGYTKFKPLVMDAYDRGYVKVVTEGLVDWVMSAGADFGSIEDDSEVIEYDGPQPVFRNDFGYQGDDDPASGAITKDTIRFCDSLEQRSRYITFRYLTQNLSQQPWMQLDFDYLVRAMNKAIEDGLFTRETYEDFDEYTGYIRRLPTLKLNRDHPDVREALETATADRLAGA